MYQWIKYCVHGTHIPQDEGEQLEDLYNSKIQDGSNNRIETLRRDIARSDAMLVHIAAMAAFLRQERNDEVIAILQDDPYFINLSFDNLNADIDRMMAMHKSKHFKLQKQIAEYERHIEGFGEQTEPTEEDWHKQLHVLEKWQGIRLKAKDITILDYILYLNDFKADIKRQENEHQARIS